MALARDSDLFAAGVDIHGVHDWNVGIRTFVPTYDRPSRSRRASHFDVVAARDVDTAGGRRCC